MSDELKPCPFCGSATAAVKMPEEYTYYIKCRQCEARGPETGMKAAAIKCWNALNRPPSPPVKTLHDELASAALTGLPAHSSGEHPHKPPGTPHGLADAMPATTGEGR